eukprot:g23922.t1
MSDLEGHGAVPDWRKFYGTQAWELLRLVEASVDQGHEAGGQEEQRRRQSESLRSQNDGDILVSGGEPTVYFPTSEVVSSDPLLSRGATTAGGGSSSSGLTGVERPVRNVSPLGQGGDVDGEVVGASGLSVAGSVSLDRTSVVSSNKGVPRQWDGAAVSAGNVVPDGEKRSRRQKGDDVRSCYSDVPKGTRVIGVRFADFDKYQGEECIEQKSRVAAKGFMQRKWIDCGDVVIPTPDEWAIRTIFALATLQRVFLEAGDDESAFLKAKRDTPDHYFEAWAGVNGLRDSGHLYHTRCVLPFYASVGLEPNPYDRCLFMGVDSNTKRTVLAVTHVDDYALAPPSEDYSNWFWGRLRERQGNIKVSKPIKVLLGREVWQYVDGEGVFHTHVTVREYIMDLIRKYPRADRKQWTPVAVPWLPSTGVPTRPSEFERYSPIKICGDLGWVRCVLWEVVAPLSSLAEMQSKPAEFNYAAAEQLFRYIIGQAEQGLHYSSDGNDVIYYAGLMHRLQ